MKKRAMMLSVAVGSLLARTGVAALAEKPPNILLMLADDLGYRDLSCFGGTAVKTPNLDRLAAQGMKFTHFYSASAVCTPARASIMTGRYPLRFNITRHFNDIDGFLPEAATTLPELLRDAGYTTIHIGKWHLGGLHVDGNGLRMNDQPGPRQHGFEIYQTQIEQQPLRGMMGKEKTLYRKGGTVLLRNDQRVSSADPYEPKHLTEANGDFALQMLEECAKSNRPFFLNLWWLAPHAPYEPAPEPYWSETAADNISEDQHCFRSMVRHMDAKAGQILAKLDELSLTDNTLVVFTSDNGAAYEGHIGDLKGGKTDLHEGGTRVPMIVRWPGKIPAGRETEVFGSTIDLLPTLCAAARVALPKDVSVDGISLLPYMTGTAAPDWAQRKTVFWQLDLYKTIQRHYPKPKPYATEVARFGRWKMLSMQGVPVELFDIDADPNEQNNLLSQHPEQASSMADQVKAWLAEQRITN